jgi:protein-disulfide isomerase
VAGAALPADRRLGAGGDRRGLRELGQRRDRRGRRRGGRCRRGVCGPGRDPGHGPGAADAPVTIIEYGSFTCPHCADWHETSYPQLKADYIDTGEVRFIFREVYFDRPGLWASMIARCGGEMRFFPVHDLIYENQRDWIGDSQPATIADNLRRLGISAGLEAEQVDACLRDETQAEALVAWFQGNATADGIDSTPTFLINGETHSNMAWEEMQAIIDAELAEAAQ